MAAKKIFEWYTSLVENLQRYQDDYELQKRKKNDDYEPVEVETNFTPENPWLLLPSPLSSFKTLNFYNIFDSRAHEVKLPISVHGGTVCGSSKGWLFIAKAKELFLFNPVSGARHQLPSLFTLPNFYHGRNVTVGPPYQHPFYHKNNPMDTQTKASMFINRFELSSENPCDRHCVVAAVLDFNSVLVCCKPNDKNWTVLYGRLSKDDDETTSNTVEVDPLTVIDCIGFCYQTLYVTSFKKFSRIEGSTTPSVVAQAFKVRLGDGYMLNLKFVPECLLFGDEQMEHNIFANIHVHVDRCIMRYMVEASEKNGQVLLVHKYMNHGYTLEEKDLAQPKLPYFKTRRFAVSKLVPSLNDENGNSFSIERINNLGDGQVLFVGGGSPLLHSTNQPTSTRGNCIYFIDDLGYVSETFQPYLSFDSGVFYLGDGKIKRPFPSVKDHMQSRMFWFNPNY